MILLFQRAARSLALGAALCCAVVVAPDPAGAQTYIRRYLAGEDAPPAAEALVERARSQMGRRYVWGGNTPQSGFDCSGFIRFVFAGVRLPRTSAEQARVGVAVPRDVAQLRVGDLLTFGRRGRISHIGMYVGGGRYIHASSDAGRVTESPVPQRDWWQGVRRLSAPSGVMVPARARTSETQAASSGDGAGQRRADVGASRAPSAGNAALPEESRLRVRRHGEMGIEPGSRINESRLRIRRHGNS